jgi:hypothetical protein
MPASLDGARQWLTDYRADKSLDVSTPVASNPVAGDAFEDRLNRLRNSEKAIAGESKAPNQQQMDLVTSFVASQGEEKDRTEKRLATINHWLIQLRKQHASVTKIAYDLELKKAAANKDLINIGTVHDSFVKLGMRFSQFVRPFSSDERDAVRDCYAAMTSIIAGELNKMVRDLIWELRNPGTEAQL